LYQQSLQACKTIYGLRHPATARVLNDLASLYQDMADFAQAQTLYEQSLDIRTRLLGADHPENSCQPE